MEYNEISFCNKTAYNMKNNKEKKNILDTLKNKFTIDVTHKNFVFSRKLQNLIKSNQYIMSCITQGNKYFIYLTKFQNENYTLLIDTKIVNGHKLPKILIIQLNFNYHLYNNTLFIGQLVKNKSHKWTFIIDDLIIYNNIFENKDIIKRREKITHILKQEFIIDPYLNLFSLRINKLFNLNQVEYVINNYIPSLDYNIVGLLLYPVSFKPKNTNNTLPIIDIFFKKNNNTIIKSEKNIKHVITVDTSVKNQTVFQIRKSNLPDIYNLYVVHNENLEKHSIARVDTIECSQFLKNTFEKKDSISVECKYSKQFKKWIPQKEVSAPISTKQYIDSIVNTF